VTNIHQRAINSDQADREAKNIQNALDSRAMTWSNYCSKLWPAHHNQHSAIIGD
jgi:hypothetical protein